MLLNHSFAPYSVLSDRSIRSESNLPLLDKDGNEYTTVVVGEQQWIVENFKSTKYANDSDIPLIENGTTLKYGRLYNWYTISGLAPTGWHVPSDAECVTLNNYLTSISNTGGALKESGYDTWDSPNTGATNGSGFTGKGSGYRHQDGYFNELKQVTYYWTTGIAIPGYGEQRLLEFSSDLFRWNYSPFNFGASIRLIRDDLVGYIEGEQLTDPDGNVYDTIQIGTQVWIKQNYASTKYANGDPILNIIDNNDWLLSVVGAYCNYNHDESYVFNGWSSDTTGAMCYYDSNIINKPVYGALYNWYAVNNTSGLVYLERGGIQETGWRVPTDSDFNILTLTLMGSLVAGGKLKEIGTSHWDSPNTGATNESGLKILPGGYRRHDNANYSGINTTTLINSNSNNALTLSYDSSSSNVVAVNNNTGTSIRLVRDINTNEILTDDYDSQLTDDQYNLIIL